MTIVTVPSLRPPSCCLSKSSFRFVTVVRVISVLVPSSPPPSAAEAAVAAAAAATTCRKSTFVPNVPLPLFLSLCFFSFLSSLSSHPLSWTTPNARPPLDDHPPMTWPDDIRHTTLFRQHGLIRQHSFDDLLWTTFLARPSWTGSWSPLPGSQP